MGEGMYMYLFFRAGAINSKMLMSSCGTSWTSCTLNSWLGRCVQETTQLSSHRYLEELFRVM